MNDPHVEELIYHVETGEELDIIDPPPVEEKADEFRMKLDDDIATFSMKKHYPSEQSAWEPVEAYVVPLYVFMLMVRTAIIPLMRRPKVRPLVPRDADGSSTLLDPQKITSSHEIPQR
jgi:hypothetical protein